MNKKILFLIGLTLFNGLLPSEATAETGDLSKEEAAKKNRARRRNNKKKRNRKNKQAKKAQKAAEKTAIEDYESEMIQHLRTFIHRQLASCHCENPVETLINFEADLVTYALKDVPTKANDIQTVKVKQGLLLLTPSMLEFNALNDTVFPYNNDHDPIYREGNQYDDSVRMREYLARVYLNINYVFDPHNNLFREKIHVDKGSANSGFVFDPSRIDTDEPLYVPCADINKHIKTIDRTLLKKDRPRFARNKKKSRRGLKKKKKGKKKKKK